MIRDDSEPNGGDSVELRLFGHPPSAARAVIANRSVGWRWSRALVTGLGAIGAAALGALIPPHVPWVAVILSLGGVLAVRRLLEERTLLGLDGNCPRCSAVQALGRPTRLRVPHRLHCPSCGHRLELWPTDLQR
ncbi:MAG: hypothetical protein ABFS34_12405 [Gemmatimonadota bacterium]